MAIVILIVGALLCVWPTGLTRFMHFLRPVLPAKSDAANLAARIAGALLIFAALIFALATG